MAEGGQLEGKVAIITGGGSGIGRALCLGLAEEGAAIAVADLRLPAAQETASEVRERGGAATAVEVNVSQSASVDAMVQSVLAGSGHIDVLVNCAGIYPRHSVVEMTEEEWRQVLDVNLTGPFLCCKAVAGPMMAQGSGKMVNLVSGRGVTGAINGAHYSASKGGLIAFTVSLGMELGPYRHQRERRRPRQHGYADVSRRRERAGAAGHTGRAGEQAVGPARRPAGPGPLPDHRRQQDHVRPGGLHEDALARAGSPVSIRRLAQPSTRAAHRAWGGAPSPAADRAQAPPPLMRPAGGELRPLGLRQQAAATWAAAAHSSA